MATILPSNEECYRLFVQVGKHDAAGVRPAGGDKSIHVRDLVEEEAIGGGGQAGEAAAFLGDRPATGAPRTL
jgi:hypothetical protein